MLISDERLDLARRAMDMACAPISGKHIGVCLTAIEPYTEDKSNGSKRFTGCNIELSTSMVFHAERVALIKAISEGYTLPLELTLIADNESSCMPLCGYCRQDYMYLNPNLIINVYHPDKQVKYYELKLLELMKYPYMGRSGINGTVE